MQNFDKKCQKKDFYRLQHLKTRFSKFRGV